MKTIALWQRALQKIPRLTTPWLSLPLPLWTRAVNRRALKKIPRLTTPWLSLPLPPLARARENGLPRSLELLLRRLAHVASARTRHRQLLPPLQLEATRRARHSGWVS